jgi:hypothetical protein
MEGGLYVCAQADLLFNLERKHTFLCSEDVWGLPKELESRLTQQFGGFIRRLRYSFLVQSEMKRNGSEILFTRKEKKCVFFALFRISLHQSKPVKNANETKRTSIGD